jgi:uncharacterized protein (TIGR02099 family)
VLRPVKYFLRLALLSLLLLYFAAAATMLTVRYWALPRINDWRPLIEQHVSAAVGAKVTIANISADWSGLNPTLAVRDLAVNDVNGDVLLQVPDAFALVSWRSLLTLELRLGRLEINGIDLTATRHTDGTVSVAGQRLEPHTNEQLKLDRNSLAVRWLLDQGEIVIRQASFRWHDQVRQAPVLNLSQIDLSLINNLFRHELRLIASLPESVGKRFELIVRTENILNQLALHPAREAEIFVEIQDVHLEGLAPWIELPKMSGNLAARAWIDVQDGLLGQTILEVSAKKIALPLATHEQHALFAQTGQLRLTGWLADLLPEGQWPVLARSANQQGLALSATATALNVDSELFAPSLLELGDVTARAKVFKNAAGKLAIDSAQLDLKSPELAAQLQGSWVAGPATGASASVSTSAGASANTDASTTNASAGRVDLTGLIAKAPANKLHQYVTTLAPPEARQFLRSALTQGRFTQTTVTLKGDLDHFPFNQTDGAGVFRLEGQYSGLTVDYDPIQVGQLHWPQVAQAQGQLVLNNASLSLTGSSAVLLDTTGARLEVSRLALKVPDLMLQPVLSLDVVLDGQAKDYLSVLRGAPLPSALKPALERLEITGQLTVPLALQARLDTDQAPGVKGQVNFSGNTVSLGADVPALDHVSGVLEFSEQSVRTEQLKVQFLGGESLLRGAWGEGAQSLQAEGSIAVAALKDSAGAKALLPFTGQARYKAQVASTKDRGYEAVVSSTLEGLSVNLPAPLGKAAQSRTPLTVRWVATPVKNDFRQTLSFNVGSLINGRFERPAGARPSPYFSRAAVTTGEAVQLPPSGLALDIKLDKVDFNDWSALFEQVTQEPKRTSKAEAKVFPSVATARLRSPQLIVSELTFTDLDVTATQSAANDWSARVASKETAGSATWRAAAGALDGRIQARFSKLTLGVADEGQTEALKIDVLETQRWSDIPAIDLTIDDFTLYGSQLGRLQLVGSNQQRTELWNIEKLDIRSAAATTTATGQWRLKGPTRGIRLNGEVIVSDLGQFSTQMGHPERVKGGSGTIQAQIDWLNFPWAYSYQGLNGSAKVAFKNGVFEHVSSRSARLLELLSLQSLQRILSFNFRPGDEFKEGFPWNALTGSFEFTKGVVHTKDLTINSPIASILLIGKSDLDKKIWDMEADVRPQFDMSGAALATAFVVNPIAGLSALATQFLLRNPIEKAMTVKYAVTGPWDDPKLEPRGAPAPAATPNRAAPVPTN